MNLGTKVIWTHNQEEFKGFIESIMHVDKSMNPDEVGTVIYAVNIGARTVRAYAHELSLYVEE